MPKKKIAVAGATGYTGRELVRLLLGHPAAEIVSLVSSSAAGKGVSEVVAAWSGILDLQLSPPDWPAVAREAEFVFLCLPHTKSAVAAKELLSAGTRVVDLSADFRLKLPELYRDWYDMDHLCPELLDRAVYGLPELHREELRDANLAAAPGCYPTGAILSLAPLVRLGDLGTIVINACSGVTGAGRKVDESLLFSEVNESVRAYNVGRHRHTPEIEQELSLIAGEDLRVSFTPHLIPVSRGILTTASIGLKSPPESPESLLAEFQNRYNEEPFVRLLSPDGLPSTRNVLGTNFCDIGVVYDPRTERAIAISAIDNLGKGAAGQAVQCFNLMAGIDETCGLMGAALCP